MIAGSAWAELAAAMGAATASPRPAVATRALVKRVRIDSLSFVAARRPRHVRMAPPVGRRHVFLTRRTTPPRSDVLGGVGRRRRTLVPHRSWCARYGESAQILLTQAARGPGRSR